MTEAEKVAIYLADCIAATAHDFDKHSAPKGERKRHRKLCETAADLIRGKTSISMMQGHRRDWHTIEGVADRLEHVANILRTYEEK